MSEIPRVEGESLDRFGIDKGEVIAGIEIASNDEAISDITSAQAVIPF